MTLSAPLMALREMLEAFAASFLAGAKRNTGALGGRYRRTKAEFKHTWVVSPHAQPVIARGVDTVTAIGSPSNGHVGHDRSCLRETCVREMFHPSMRKHMYEFRNAIHCADPHTGAWTVRRANSKLLHTSQPHLVAGAENALHLLETALEMVNPFITLLAHPPPLFDTMTNAPTSSILLCRVEHIVVSARLRQCCPSLASKSNSVWPHNPRRDNTSFFLLPCKYGELVMLRVYENLALCPISYHAPHMCSWHVLDNAPATRRWKVSPIGARWLMSLSSGGYLPLTVDVSTRWSVKNC
jgi:hypothetical protein